MIFNAENPTDLDKVAEYIELALRSAIEVDRPLTLTDAPLIQVGCLNSGLLKAEAWIAELEARLTAHEAQKKH
jgi:hypothetical protein